MRNHIVGLQVLRIRLVIVKPHGINTIKKLILGYYIDSTFFFLSNGLAIINSYLMWISGCQDSNQDLYIYYAMSLKQSLTGVQVQVCSIYHQLHLPHLGSWMNDTWHKWIQWFRLEINKTSDFLIKKKKQREQTRASLLFLSYVNLTHSLFNFPHNLFVSPLISANNHWLCPRSSQSSPFIHLSITRSSSPLHASSPLLVTVVAAVVSNQTIAVVSNRGIWILYCCYWFVHYLVFESYMVWALFGLWIAAMNSFFWIIYWFLHHLLVCALQSLFLNHLLVCALQSLFLNHLLVFASFTGFCITIAFFWIIY